MNPPIDNGCVGFPFYHNPGAYDIDGDSLSYHLTVCKGADGLNILGYTYPTTSNIFTLDPHSGDLVWDSPKYQGEYNIAMRIEEWRNGYLIGYVTRDMQITILACDNRPPEIDPIPDTCVEAGDTISFMVNASDIDMDYITLTATGGPIVIQPDSAIFPQPVSGGGSVSSIFTWYTKCSHVQKYPYYVFFRVIDNGTPVNLIDIETVSITVVGPAPKNLLANAVGNSIELAWNKSECTNAIGYRIYRKDSYYGYFHSHCETGVPNYTGYKKIDEFTGIDDTTYIDDNHGNGLIHGNDYCYMVIAYYPDGAESYASLEACASLKKDVPVITNVSINTTSITNGSVYIAWSKPTEFDTIQIPGPYKYFIYRSEDSTGSNMVLIDSLLSIKDTTYTDILLNTEDNPVSYRIDFYNNDPGNRFYVGSTHIATSIFLAMIPSDNELHLFWNENVPWINDQYVVYRRDPATMLFDSIGFTTVNSFIDTGLINGKEYCYKVKSIGRYSDSGFINPIINYSQFTCGVPEDNISPCPPNLRLTTDCEFNYLNWNNPNDSCADDVVKYKIYYTPSEGGDFALLTIITDPDNTSFVHRGFSSIAGCYFIVAVDFYDNESVQSNIECIDIDNCELYRLPNVFTPNGDFINDLFVPFPYDYVERIDIKIFNRWGAIVFETTDPDINWDGKDKNTNKDCSTGVYYFVCDVYEIRLHGPVKRTISGSVTLMRN